MEIRYNFKSVEERLSNFWRDLYKFDRLDRSRPTYAIDTPPPYPSGEFHVGNALNWSYFDFVARYKRMRGFNVHFPQGWDCHGLPTEVRVENILGKRKSEIPPQTFIKLSREYTEKWIEEMKRDVIRLGISIDWSLEYKTMDPDYWKKISEKILGGDTEALSVVKEVFFIDPDWDSNNQRKIASEYARAVANYWELRKSGLSREEARYILPQAIVSKIIVTMNAREILHFLGLRMCTHAQKEIRLVAWLLWRELMKIHPRLFKYAGPYCLIDNNLHSSKIYSLEDLLEGSIEFGIDRCRELVPRNGIIKCVRHSYEVFRDYVNRFSG